MTKITLYDSDAKRLEHIADYNDTTVAELISAILDQCDDSDICDSVGYAIPID